MSETAPRPIEALNLEVLQDLARAHEMTVDLIKHTWPHEALTRAGLQALLKNIYDAQDRCTQIDTQFRAARKEQQ